MVPLEAVQALSTRHHTPLDQLDSSEVAVLRVDTAQPAKEPDRAWTGFSSFLAPDDLLSALRGWWRCDPAAVAAGQVLPVTLSGYVVAVLTGLQQWEKNTQGRHAFPKARLAGYVTDLVTPHTVMTSHVNDDRHLAGLLLGTRLVSHSGGAVAYVPANATA
ncbi:DNA-binding protein [Streptomyces sp. NPDC007126]|uniref:DNA-binding protein n=1 Tax=Streptomyces sp. NPDC007126 TaxID=3364774 RepID=UPI00367508D9